mgnify:CR=1 FL=1
MLVHPTVFKTDCLGYSPRGRFDSCAPPPIILSVVYGGLFVVMLGFKG